MDSQNDNKCDQVCKNQPCQRTKIATFFSILLCHNSHFSLSNKIKFTPQMQKFMGNLMKLTEWKYLLQNIRYC